MRERLRQIAPKALDCLEDGLEDALAVLALPGKYRQRLRSTNMLERLNEEVRRRERVIRIFPTPDAAIRLLGALLAETHETWQETKYFDMGDFHAWLEERSLNPDDGNTIRLRS